jgi:hypothetical protein
MPPSFTEEIGEAMSRIKDHANVVLLRGATLWLIVAIILAWCLVGLGLGITPLKMIFSGKFQRVLQAHLDYLIMSSLLFGFYAARVSLPRHIKLAMVIGAFTNSSLFLLMAIFPTLDNPALPQPLVFQIYMFASILTTSYGFGKGSLIVFQSTWVSD